MYKSEKDELCRFRCREIKYLCLFLSYSWFVEILRIVVLIIVFSTSIITMHALNGADFLMHLLMGSWFFALSWPHTILVIPIFLFFFFVFVFVKYISHIFWFAVNEGKYQVLIC